VSRRRDRRERDSDSRAFEQYRAQVATTAELLEVAADEGLNLEADRAARIAELRDLADLLGFDLARRPKP
jgi:hypothetical protein